MPISKKEVHDIELVLTGKEGSVTIEELETYVATLKGHGFGNNDRVDIFGVSTNQKAYLTAKRSLLYDKMNALDKSVANLET